MLRAIIISSIGLNVGLLLGRLSGFAREAFVATSYGVSSEADVVVLMLTVPDLLVNILMGGAMGAMLIPAFTGQPRKAKQILYQASILFGVIFTGLTLILVQSSSLLVYLLAPGFDASLSSYAAKNLEVVLWLLPLTVLAGISTAYLHAENRFFIASLGTLIINCSIIAGLLFAYHGEGSLALVAGFVLLGGGLRLFSQLIFVPMQWNPVSAMKNWLLTRSMMVRYGQAMFSGSLLLLFPVVVRALASFSGDGSVALLNYSVRLVEFPLVISVTFLSVILFPRLAQSYADNPALHRRLIEHGVRICLVLSSIAAVTLMTVSNAYAEFVFDHGIMSDAGVNDVATLASVGLISLPFQGLSSLLTAIFNSRLDMRTPMLINSAGLLFLFLGNSIGLYGQGLEALMWMLVSSYALICFLQLVFLKIDRLSWVEVFSGNHFMPALLLALSIAAIGCYGVRGSGLSAWISLVLAALVALASIGLVALLSKDLRMGLVKQVGEK